MSPELKEMTRLGGLFWQPFTEGIRETVKDLNRERAENQQVTFGWTTELDFDVFGPGDNAIRIFISTVPTGFGPFVHAQQVQGHSQPLGSPQRKLSEMTVLLRPEGERLVGYAVLKAGQQTNVDLPTPPDVARFLLEPFLSTIG